MKQRGTFSITTLILQALQQRPLTKTRLMQTLILNYPRVGSYCELLMRKGLIEYDLRIHAYVITPRGLEVLGLNRELAGYAGADLQEYAGRIDSSKPTMHHWQ